MKKISIPLGCACILHILNCAAQADVIALYNFPPGQGTTLPSASTASSPLAVAADLSLGDGFPTISDQPSGISSSSGNPVNSLFLRQTNNSTETLAVDFNKYITFSVTPSSSLNMTSLDFDYFRNSGNSATDFALRTNADGDNFTTTIASGTMSGSSTWTGVPLDLTGVSDLQNIGSGVEFRLYVWGANANSDIVRFDNIALNAVAVPEPGTFAAILGLGALLLVSRRLRRH